MTRQLILDLLPAPSPTLGNFVVGDNGAALDAVRQLRPGRALYLWGAPGAGRTHLLRAGAAQPGSRYMAADGPADFLRELSESGAPPAATVAVDDVHLLGGPDQAALFALYNRWRESAAGPGAFSLLVAGDRSPRAMPLREDLRTRLGWDLVFRLEHLSDHDLQQALHARAGERGLQLSAEVTGWILTHYARDMGRLSALLAALDRYSLEKHRAVTVPLLKDLLASSPPQEKTDL